MVPGSDIENVWVHEGDLYKTLLRISNAAREEAIEVVRGILYSVAPSLKGPGTKVLLNIPEAEVAFETMLSSLENALWELCARHDYRQILHVSRLCSSVPELMWQDVSHEDRKFRTLSADRWILRCAPRKLSYDYASMALSDYRLRAVPDSLCEDAAKMHVLAHLHQRTVVEKTRFNFMRLVSSRNGLPGPTLRLHGDPTIGWDLHSDELHGSLMLFYEREQDENGPLAWWGLADVAVDDEFFALSAYPNPSLGEQGMLFNPGPVSLDAWLEYGRRFGNLFERSTGMPAEHFWAISRALGSFGLEAVLADGSWLQRWVLTTATIPLRREELLGGSLVHRAVAELDELGTFSDLRKESMNRSVERFVRLALSSSDSPALKAAQAELGTPDSNSAALRSDFYPYIIHGTEEHEYWLVDYLMTVPFIRGVVNEIAFSESKKTTSSGNDDAFVRTSVFDAHLAKELTSIPGYEETFTAHRTDPELPNVTFFFDGGASSREIDVTVQLGEVLIAVQTWTPTVNEKVMAGERRAMERRWNKARNKLKDTDQKYTDYLIGTDKGREHMASNGLRYILPVVCGPYAEPQVSLDREFWLRYPQFDTSETAQRAVPRILTPSELKDFLGDATEQELRIICEQRGFVLQNKNPS